MYSILDIWAKSISITARSCKLPVEHNLAEFTNSATHSPRAIYDAIEALYSIKTKVLKSLMINGFPLPFFPKLPTWYSPINENSLFHFPTKGCKKFNILKIWQRTNSYLIKTLEIAGRKISTVFRPGTWGYYQFSWKLMWKFKYMWPFGFQSTN